MEGLVKEESFHMNTVTRIHRILTGYNKMQNFTSGKYSFYILTAFNEYRGKAFRMGKVVGITVYKQKRQKLQTINRQNVLQM